MKHFGLIAVAAVFASCAALAAPQGFNQSAVPSGPAGFDNQAPLRSCCLPVCSAPIYHAFPDPKDANNSDT